MKYQKILRNLLVIFLLPFLSNFDVKKLNSQEKLSNYKSKNIQNNFEDVYIIGPGDLLAIYFINNESQFREIKILRDGTASIPYIGYLNINELTLNEAKELIEKKLSQEIITPFIELKLLKERPIRISVIGEVQLPGIYNLDSQILNKTISEFDSSIDKIASPTIIDALIASGGITKNANIREVDIKRKLPKSVGGYKKGTIDLYKLILEGDFYQNLNLYDGDIISIKRVEKPLSQNHEIFNTNLTSNKIDIYITGEVKSPGKFKLESNTKLVQAIYKAGGPVNYRANKGRVDIIRNNVNGSISIKKFKLKLKDNISDDLNPTLQNGDIVRVSTNNLANVSDALETVTKPISSLINFYTFYRIISDD